MSTECLIQNDLFKVTIKNNNMNIMLISELTCNQWGNYWSSVRDHLFNNQSPRNITVNFEKCLSADPMPMLSILLELIKAKSEYNKLISIVLPSIFSNDYESKNFQRGQFLKYLASQGFLEIMFLHFTVKNQKATLIKEVINKYNSYNYKLNFSGEVIVPAQIFECSNEDTKEDILSAVLEAFSFTFKNRVALRTYNTLNGHIYNIVNELIENAVRHAYDVGEKKRFALYIRNRRGIIDENVSSDCINGFNKQEINRERNNYPAVDTQIYMDNSAFLEIYFSDIGMGLTESLKEYYKKDNKVYRYPVRELFCKVLKDGIRKNSDGSITPFGGLHFICRIIRENNGYIWCNEGYEWVGASSVRLLNDGFKSVKGALTGELKNDQSTGLNWCFRIPYDDFDMKNKNVFFYKWKGDPKSHPVYKAYGSIDKNLHGHDVFCLDERRDQVVLMRGDYLRWEVKRTSEIISFSILPQVKTLVWFPKPNYSKNQISRQLKQYFLNGYFQSSENKLDNIIIGDINSNELISYYYAFHHNTTKVLGRESIKKLVLITNKWEIICFKNIDGILERAIEDEIKYFSSTHGDMVYDSIQNYCYFVRTYDSYSFWRLIQKYANEKIYINADVSWGNQIIHGYLDLVRLHLYEDVYKIVANSLIRMSGFVDETNIEYRNIDQTVERICQDLNTNISIQNDRVVPINVCGACVTGYTRESYYCDSDYSLNTILFLHPMFDKSLKDVAILYIWPDEGFFNEFNNDEEKYYRLGKTCFITSNSQESLIDLSTIYNNVTRNKGEMYEDFQVKVPRFIRYGHYKTDNHHYLIGFDFISYIKYSYIKKEGAFLYFLWKILYYLGGENIESLYSSFVDSEWETALKKSHFKKDSNHGEIVVYHSNTFTEYVMRLIKTIVPEDIVQKIIPVNILELQEKGGPIAFSPFVMKRIETEFSNKETRGILYVDSSFSTGRRMLEIENMFLAAGCKKVSFLTILDMRRLRNRDFKNNSYWKLNLPRLDDDGHCILCDTLNKIAGYSKKTDAVIGARLIEWQRNWSCMNVNNSISEHGIEMFGDLSCNFGNIYLRDSITLNMYVAERICESYNNDFVYSYITDQKTDLKPFLRLQLICTQILLFGNQHSRKLQLSLLSELVSIMAKSETETSYTSLAGMVIISQKPEVIYELLNEILYINKATKIKQIKGYMLASNNKDLVIAIGYFLKNNYLIEQLLNGFPEKNNLYLLK